MKQPKPILIIKQKCSCNCHNFNEPVLWHMPQGKDKECLCRGTGQQTTEIYALRDFEKCNGCSGTGEQLGKLADTKDGMVLVMQPCEDCKGVDYIIPKEYKPYEIKKVSEINTKEFTFNQSWNFWDEVEKHNLKEDDKVVITNAK